MNLAAILAALENLPTLFDALKGIIGLFHHSPSAPPAGTSTPTIPPSQPQTPTPIAVSPSPAPVVAPAAPQAPSVPSEKWVPGRLQILGSTHQGVPVKQPFGNDTHLHLDHNLENALPWPDSLSAVASVSVDYLWDGQKSDSDPVSNGSIDKDGYASRFNIGTLPDFNSHKLELALVLDGVHGPWLLLAVQANRAGDGDGQYHAAFWRQEGPDGTDGWVFHNAINKQLYESGKGIPGYGCGGEKPTEPAKKGTIKFCPPG